MPILFFTDGPSLFGGATACSESPRKSKQITLQELKLLTEAFWTRTQLADMPIDLKDKLLAGCRFPLREVEMLIRQNPEAEYLQMNYAIDSAGKHFHYMVAAKKDARITVDENSLILEDCCRIPPNTATIASFF